LIVLDASLVLAWLATEELPASDSGVYEALPLNVVLVPSHWPLEISNALRSRMRAGRMTIGDFHAVMDRLDQLTIELQPPIELDEIGPLTHFAVMQDLTAYDAAYVQLAFRSKVPLATLDREMRAAAMRLAIPLLPVATG
jgi:predicted nucleic acid-binding protein